MDEMCKMDKILIISNILKVNAREILYFLVIKKPI